MICPERTEALSMPEAGPARVRASRPQVVPAYFTVSPMEECDEHIDEEQRQAY